MQQFWSGAAEPFEDRHYRLAETLNSPPAVSRPHPPILIGGMGERKTLRLVAKYADACNLFAFAGVAERARKLGVLREHCAREGRPYDEIEKTTLGTANLRKQSAQQLVDECGALVQIGIEHAIFNLPHVDDPSGLETFGRDVIPAVASV